MIGSQPGQFFKMADSNMAATGRSVNPCDFSKHILNTCNTSNPTENNALVSFLTLVFQYMANFVLNRHFQDGRHRPTSFNLKYFILVISYTCNISIPAETNALRSFLISTWWLLVAFVFNPHF